MGLIAALPSNAAAQAHTLDSAGIPIIVNEAPQSRWHLSIEPTLTIGIGIADPDYEFTEIVGAVRLNDGQYVVADRASLDLRIFDESGRHIRTAGRYGGGPGEFRNIYWLGRDPGDTILVYDANLRRLSRFAPTGSYVGGTFIDGLPEMNNPIPFGRLPDGSYLLWTDIKSVSGDPPTRVERPQLPLYRLSADGQNVTSLGRFPWMELAIVPAEGGGYWRDFREFGRATGFVVWNDEVVAADNAQWELRLFGGDGELHRVIRKTAREIEITAGDVEALHAATLDRLPEPLRRRTARRYEVGPPLPRTFPAHAARMVTGADRLWVKEYQRPGDTASVWSIFDHAGQWVSTLAHAADLELLDIANDLAVMRARDEDGVQFVAVYGIVRH